MLRVKHIIQQLSESQSKQVRELLAQDDTYQEVTLLIFDAYLENKTEEEARLISRLEVQAFKVFERVIYRTLLGYFNIEDTSVKDLLETSIFYALYGSTSKTDTEKSKELEQLFHQMKRYGVEQQSAELLAQLYKLNQDSPLEAVYDHLHNKYLGIAEANEEAIDLFSELNSKLAALDKESSDKRGLVHLFKQIRSLHFNFKNKTSSAILKLAKAELVVLAGQTQLLKDGDLSIGNLLIECKEEVESLPFGFLRYYLRNILVQLRITFLYQENKIDDAKVLYSNCKSTDLFKANNLNFSSKWVRAIKGLLEEKEISMDAVNDYQLGIGKLRFNQAIETAFNKNYFGRERLSLFLN